MMNRFTIQVNNELHALSQLIKKVQKNAGEKKIHRLRVVIKKIRAYYALLPATQSFKKAFPALARLNLAAQALRDLQVLQKNISSLPAWKTAEVASSILNDHLKKKENALYRLLKKEKFCNLLQHELTLFSQLATQAQWQQLKQNFEDSLLHLPKKRFAADWHSMRKKMKKDWFEAQALFGRQTQTKYPNEEFHLQDLPQQLGNWHDWVVVCEFMEEIHRHLPAAEYALLKQQAWRQREEWENKLRPVIHTFLQVRKLH